MGSETLTPRIEHRMVGEKWKPRAYLLCKAPTTVSLPTSGNIADTCDISASLGIRTPGDDPSRPVNSLTQSRITDVVPPLELSPLPPVERRVVGEELRRAVVIGPSSSSMTPLARDMETSDDPVPPPRARLVRLGGRVDPITYGARPDERRINHGGS